MSEISYLRERASAMRSAMDNADLPDAIDTVLDYLHSVEVSRQESLTRVAELEGHLREVHAAAGIVAAAPPAALLSRIRAMRDNEDKEDGA